MRRTGSMIGGGVRVALVAAIASVGRHAANRHARAARGGAWMPLRSSPARIKRRGLRRSRIDARSIACASLCDPCAGVPWVFGGLRSPTNPSDSRPLRPCVAAVFPHRDVRIIFLPAAFPSAYPTMRRYHAKSGAPESLSLLREDSGAAGGSGQLAHARALEAGAEAVSGGSLRASTAAPEPKARCRRIEMKGIKTEGSRGKHLAMRTGNRVAVWEASLSPT